MYMKHLSETEKYYEVRGTLEFVIRALRAVYNDGMFNSAQKRYIFNILKRKYFRIIYSLI